MWGGGGDCPKTPHVHPLCLYPLVVFGLVVANGFDPIVEGLLLCFFFLFLLHLGIRHFGMGVRPAGAWRGSRTLVQDLAADP